MSRARRLPLSDWQTPMGEGPTRCSFVLPYLLLLLLPAGATTRLPLAVACPEARFTLVDSRSKKLTVVRALVDEFGLGNVDVVHGRVEECVERQFDFVLGRAVTSLPPFVGWVQPRCRLDPPDGNPWGRERGILYIKYGAPPSRPGAPFSSNLTVNLGILAGRTTPPMICGPWDCAPLTWQPSTSTTSSAAWHHR